MAGDRRKSYFTSSTKKAAYKTANVNMVTVVPSSGTINIDTLVSRLSPSVYCWVILTSLHSKNSWGFSDAETGPFFCNDCLHTVRL